MPIHLTFASPWWGLGVAAAVLLVVAAHLLSRRGGRHAVFPAVRFVLDAQAEAARWHRLRHWAAMLLRAAAVGLIALAFMQPTWRPPAAAAVGDAAGEHVVLVVDRTASMQRATRGATLFDDARRRAINELQALDPQRDRASVVLLDARPSLLLPEPSARTDALIARLNGLDVTYEHGRLADALARVREAHRRLPGEPARALRVEIFSDAQATHWPEAAWPALRAEAAAVRHHALRAATDNLAIARPSVSPAQPVVGQPATVRAEVSNHGESSATLEVALQVNAADAVADRQAVDVEPGDSAAVSFEVTFETPGVTPVALSLVDADDALPADDRAGLFVSVRPARPVHLLTRADVDDPARAAYFVARALRPGGGATEAEAAQRLTGVALQVASPDRLTEDVAALERDAVLVLVEAGALSSAERAGLAAHLRRGGAAVWVVDDEAARQAVMALGADGDVRPAVLPAVGVEDEAWAARRLAAGRFDRAVLAVFEGPARSALLRGRFAQTWAGRLADDAEGLLYFADGSPALAWRGVGEGRLAMLAASLSPGQSDFVRGPAAAPLLHQLVRHLSPGEAGPATVVPGQPLGLEPTADQVVIGPDGEAVGPSSRRRVREPGGYGLQDAATGRWAAGVWVDVDPAESDLRPVAAERVAAVERAARGPAAGVVTARAEAVALWPWCVVAGVVLLMIEPVVAAGLGQTRGRGPTVAGRGLRGVGEA